MVGGMEIKATQPSWGWKLGLSLPTKVVSSSYLKLSLATKATAQSGLDLAIMFFQPTGRSATDNNATQPSWPAGAWAWLSLAISFVSVPSPWLECG